MYISIYRFFLNGNNFRVFLTCRIYKLVLHINYLAKQTASTAAGGAVTRRPKLNVYPKEIQNMIQSNEMYCFPALHSFGPSLRSKSVCSPVGSVRSASVCFPFREPGCVWTPDCFTERTASGPAGDIIVWTKSVLPLNMLSALVLNVN